MIGFDKTDVKKDFCIKEYLYVLVICILYVLPIILANRYYFDDTQRVIYHDTGWALDGRPLTELVTRLMCGLRSGVYDIFPLPLLLAVVLFAFVSLIWVRRICDASGTSGVIAAFLPIALPFFLANLSYRFDCFGMTASVVLLMVPFILDISSGWKRVLAGFVCILLSMSFHQAAVGLFAGLALIVAFWKLLGRRPFAPDLLCDVISLGLGALVYKYVIATVFVDKSGWRAEAKALYSGTSVVSHVIENIRSVCGLVIKYARGAGAKQLIVYVAVFTAGGVALFLWLRKDEHPHRLWAVLAYVLLPAVSFLVSILPMALLAGDYAQSRRQTGLVVIMFVVAVQILLIARRFPRIAVVLGAVVCFMQFSFSYAYGNALRAQKEYEQWVVGSVISSVGSAEDDIDTIAVSGTMPYSPIVKSTADMLPLLYDLIPAGADNDGMLGGAVFNHYSPVPLEISETTDEDLAFIEGNAPVVRNSVYDLYFNANKAYLRFKQ